MSFTKAIKGQTSAKIALTGPSGSGKTYSALLIAQGLGGRTAVIDTENSSASLYADKWPGWEYDVATIQPPYTAKKYFDLMADAIRAGYDNLIIDSATHLWAGEGGLLQQKEALDSRGGNSYTNWGSITKIHEHFKSLILNAPVNIIVTMRSKQEYIIEQNERGKSAPKKVGLAPVQREGMEYEFTCVLDIGMDHQFIASKDRTDLFDGVITKVTPAIGTAIKTWMGGGEGSSTQEVRDKFLREWTEEQKPQTTPSRQVSNAVRNMGQSQSVVRQAPINHAPQVSGEVASDTINAGHVKHLQQRAEALGIKHSQMREVIMETFGKETSLKLSRSEYELLKQALEAATLADFVVRIAEMQQRKGTVQSTVQSQGALQ